MDNGVELDKIEFVRNTLLIDHFCKIRSLGGNNCPIIPLKGISLLFSVYTDYSRNVGDIDLLVFEKDIEKIIHRLEKIGYIPKTERTIKVRLRSKGKFDMIHRDRKQCDLDVHIELINKKWFKFSIGDFTSFALSRIKTIEFNNLKINVLSATDEWLYLAQHYCFHLFSNDKWLEDLYRIQKTFSTTEVTDLIATVYNFHFERIVTAVSRRLKNNYPENEITIPEMLTKKHLIFDTVCSKNLKFAPSFSNRIIAIYWEFLFIHSCKSRINAYIRLLFPKLQILMDIYQCKLLIALLLYPIHIILVFLSSILFIPVLVVKNLNL